MKAQFQEVHYRQKGRKDFTDPEKGNIGSHKLTNKMSPEKCANITIRKDHRIYSLITFC